MPDEAELWSRIRGGDQDAFNAFYCENAPRLQAFLRRLVGDPQAAEDLVQETFTTIWKRPEGFDPERGTLRAYLFGVGRKLAAEWWRSRGRTDEELDEQPEPSHAEAASVMSDAMARLPEEQRSLLWLREVEGLSYAELAASLNVPVGTVRSRLFAAREALRKIWFGTRQEVEL